MNSNAVALGKIEFTDRTTETSQRRNARIAGILYLIIIAAGIFAEFFVRSSLMVPGDAAAGVRVSRLLQHRMFRWSV